MQLKPLFAALTLGTSLSLSGCLDEANTTTTPTDTPTTPVDVCTNLKLAEIDLGSFDTDGIPEMAAAVLYNGKVYVALQRLTNFSPDQFGQLVVINSDTYEVEDTITLKTKNPQSMQLVDGKIYVQSVGKYANDWATPATPAEYTGGIEVIDPTNNTSQLLIDDNENTKQISGMQIISATEGYLQSYASWGDVSLYKFNPSTGDIETSAFAGLAHQDLGAMQLDANGKLWIAKNSGASVVNLSDASVQNITTTMGTRGFAQISEGGNHYMVSSHTDYYSASSLTLQDINNIISQPNDQHPGTTTDLGVISYGANTYVLGKYNFNTLTQYQGSALTLGYQCNVNDTQAGANANPYDLIFASESKAFLLRYGSNKLWVINPNP